MPAPGPPRRRKVIGHRRRVEDDGEEEGGPEAIDVEDDSLTEGSIASDEHDQADDSDTSNVDEMSPTVPNTHKPDGGASAKPGFRRKVDAVKGDAPSVEQVEGTIADTQILLGRVSLADEEATAEELNFDDLAEDSASKEAAPIIVTSGSASNQRLPVQEQKRREHEEYRRKRDEDPTFVPNRGAFFLHDHRHSGPAANGFRPFPRGARGRGRGAFSGPFAPVSHIQNVPDPTTNGLWAHDMHEAVAAAPFLYPNRSSRNVSSRDGPPSGKAPVPTAPMSDQHINRAMSTQRHVANVAVRVYIPSVMSEAKTFPGLRLIQYTKLPDHRPPLRRDKPVRISLPFHQSPIMPRYIYPAHDRAFIFIPRALRPNQQRGRGKGARSTAGSVGPFSRRTSVYGSYYGSVYTPSIAMSRRSSITHDFGRDYIVSPTGSSISRPPLPLPTDHSRPVVRLPPLAQAQLTPMLPPPADAFMEPTPLLEASINDLPPPQTHPLPQKPTFQETRTSAIPIHQPRPQKTVSIENIEPPAPHSMHAPPSYQQAFHHQVPPQMTSSYAHERHTRNPSFHSQSASLTPLSQIPERAIHAAPFQPTHYPQPGFYGQPYPVMQQMQQMQQMQPPQGYYYPQQYGNMGPNASAPVFVPASQQGPPLPYDQPVQGNPQDAQTHGQGAPPQGLIVQEMGGTMYFYDPNQMPVAGYPPSYPPAYNPGMVNMGGVVTPDQNGLFYPPPAPGMVYLNS